MRVGFGFFPNQFKGLFYSLKMPDVSGTDRVIICGGHLFIPGLLQYIPDCSHISNHAL